MVYGFIGLGNMASAILRGMAASGAFADDTLCGFNRSEGKTLALWHEIGLVPCKDAAAVTQDSGCGMLFRGGNHVRDYTWSRCASRRESYTLTGHYAGKFGLRLWAVAD